MLGARWAQCAAHESDAVRKSMFRQISVLLVAGALLAGCGIFGKKEPEFIFDEEVGPNTKAQVETLPEGLVGDTENSRHTNQDLRAPEEQGNEG